ncbi:MAG: NYN domain-containing protein [bacterium]|nr:NYN domain-containing protein [bacterium]
MGRSAVFIDGAYMEFLIREEFSEMRVDFARLSQKLVEGHELLRTYYYHCLPYQGPNPTEEEARRFNNKQRFFKTLDRLPRFEVRLGEIVFRGVREDGRENFLQKRVDMMLGVDMVRLAESGQITDVALVASDSNLIPAVEAVKDCGVVVTLFHGRKAGANEDLWALCDERSLITEELVSSVQLQPRRDPQVLEEENIPSYS